MDLSLDNIELTEIYFVQKLDSREFSDIFIVRVHNQECIMKVHHGRGPREKYEPEDRELDLHIVESTAYYRLKEQGLCDRGIVPNFLGTIRNFDPSLFQPDFQTYLNHFMDDEYSPSAIFLEYIPGIQMIEPTVNFTQQHMDNIIDGIREIHKALVLHGDPRPRNMMVIKDTCNPKANSDRVIWLDFDRARTFNEGEITEEQVEWIKNEEDIVISLGGHFAFDHAQNKIEKSLKFY